MTTFNTRLRANALFAGILSTAIAETKKLDNAGASANEIQPTIHQSVADKLAAEPSSQLFYAADKLIPTASVQSTEVDGAMSLLDVIILSVARIITNDVLAFCGIEIEALPENATGNSLFKPQQKSNKKAVNVDATDQISDELRDELSGANVDASMASSDCEGGACKI